MRRVNVVLPVALAGLLAGCLPYQANAPIGHRETAHCDWVRARVKDGSMPRDIAETFYMHCAPFEVRGD